MSWVSWGQSWGGCGAWLVILVAACSGGRATQAVARSASAPAAKTNTTSTAAPAPNPSRPRAPEARQPQQGEPPPTASAAPEAPAVTAPCPANMVLVAEFCIDRHEAPNERGAAPLLMQSAADGEAWCAERGKRLCDEREWVRACAGPSGWSHPYGPRYQASRCNDDKTWRVPNWKLLRGWPSEAAATEVRRLAQAEPAGSRESCKSAAGVYDLTGNVAEWVVRTEDNPTNYGHVVKGCYWSRCYRPPHIPTCDYVNYAHHGNERSYEMGFRCCRDRDDPS